ncbi:hypothetical protein GWK47_001237 [Chionoecetes opilio]|uniref:Uncharacterized protein n=1 Tax=Chionoecetes opilio TaxID=41210 RepID=A0A8J5CNB7_CHIOP|nr:hypothetical protein GWK47_001237 [Chionoecetes opilio]
MELRRLGRIKPEFLKILPDVTTGFYSKCRLYGQSFYFTGAIETYFTVYRCIRNRHWNTPAIRVGDFVVPDNRGLTSFQPAMAPQLSPSTSKAEIFAQTFAKIALFLMQGLFSPFSSTL